MIVISDTSPICYLLLIGEIEVLPQLYQAISRLQKTTFRVSSQLIQSLLQRYQSENL